MPAVKNTFEAAKDRIHFLFAKMEYAPIIALSAINGSGIDSLLDTSVKMYAQLTRQIKTADLNDALEKWLAEHPTPSGPQSRFKIRYAVQTEANPVKFVFFVSWQDAVTEAYVSYLRNRIRRDLGFSLVPVAVEIRASSRPQDKAKKKSGPRKKR
jgi:GTP-binding protein